MISLMRPLLPDAREIQTYLEAIDAARWYTNFGPLVRAFEKRLAEHWGVADGAVASFANGTLGLTLALGASDVARGALCAMPAWTFPATPAAAVAAGLTPWFVDVDAASWALDPAQVQALLPQAPGPVGAVMPVSAFGAPVDVAAWDRFHAETGLPVVIDAAAAFDSRPAGQAPAMVSLHATKILGIGEGGVVVSRDLDLVARLRRASNFGFSPGARVAEPGVNAKMSEYAAAVGLAALDRWPRHRALYQELAEAWRTALGNVPGASLQQSWGRGWVAATLNVRLAGCEAEFAIAELGRRGIEARRWWGAGCHRQPAFAAFPRAQLPVTDALAASVLGLPFHLDLAPREIVFVCDTLRALERSAGTRHRKTETRASPSTSSG